jgi:futalosine hydrolase
MQLLLVSATDFEIMDTARWLNRSDHSHNVLKTDLLIGGIGQLKSTYAIQKQIHAKRPDLVIQAGIGGALSKDDIGRVYVIGSEKIADLGLLEKSGFTNIFEMGLSKENEFPFKDGRLINPYRYLLEWTALPLKDGVTVNEIKSSDFTGFQQYAGPVVESMEGAALHYVCLMEKIPFLQIRSVSNVIGERDKTQWKMNEALKRLNETLISLIQKLENTDETLFGI